ncbi:DUF2955 domain-containing protein [Bacteroidota bacterium]
MSAKAALISISSRSSGWTQRDVRVVRYALGATTGMAIAMGFGWELSYLVPVLSLSFLAAPDTPLTPKAGLFFIAMVGVACYVGVLLADNFIPYPGVFIPLVGIILFRIFYAGQRGRSKLLIMWLLIAVTVIPLVRLIQPSVAVFVAQGVFFDVVITVGLGVLAFLLIPEKPQELDRSASTKPVAPPVSAEEAFRSAAVSTVVVLPLLSVFYLFKMTGAVLVLVFVAILASQPAFAANFKVGKALVAGNVIGGFISILFYELLVIVPLFPFLLLMTLLLGLVLGAKVFSGKPASALFGMAFSTTLLIIGSTTSSDGDASSEVYSRVLQIMFAVVYVVAAFGVLNRLFPRKNG